MRRGRGRPASSVVKITIELQLPHDVVFWLNGQTYDVRTGKPRYGARSELIERLCREEMRSQGYDTQYPLFPKEDSK